MGAVLGRGGVIQATSIPETPAPDRESYKS
jgi:hypothetical protein